MNPVDVKSSTCIEFNKENNNGGEKLKSSWSYKNIEIWKHFCKRLHSKFVWRSFCDSKSWNTLWGGHILFLVLTENELL